MNNEFNTDVRTHINPEDEVKTAPKNGYKQVKDLMNTVHGYCMDYTKLSLNFIHDNKDLVKDVVEVGCKTAVAIAACAAVAHIGVAKILSESKK
ncbi:hypothetical protein EFR95_05235 [Lactobacillus amylovorus]|jgi:hypothetical protein|uniref:hypothetical protein n=1 Tax=Lactobacillus amylovorus TaxID=1604 RepID=UPI0021A863CF|nr:hypothetical protein [Lactobacillus amylovorus]MCT3585753.1 hypothetical protein [Lactobacillus amylovorus]